MEWEVEEMLMFELSFEKIIDMIVLSWNGRGDYGGRTVWGCLFNVFFFLKLVGYGIRLASLV